MLRHTKLIIVFLVLLTLSGCGNSASNTNTATTPESSSQATPQSSPLTEFEEALRYVKNGQYAYIWIFSRKDGKPLDKTDTEFLHINAPQVVDWVRADKEGRKIIAGTNFKLEEGSLAKLRTRYVAEDWTGR